MSLIPKHELRKIKQRVAKLRKQGHDILTDEEVEKNGWITDHAAAAQKVGLPVSKERQQESWDCGLACTQMVLGALGDIKPSPALLRERVGGTSVWTVDLAYLLSEFRVRCEYLTKTPAVSDDAAKYEGSSFYGESLEEDTRRVNILFQRAADEGVPIKKATLTATELWNLMREEDTLVIALVDERLLHQRIVPGQQQQQQQQRASSPERTGDERSSSSSGSSKRGGDSSKASPRANASPPRGKKGGGGEGGGGGGGGGRSPGVEEAEGGKGRKGGSKGGGGRKGGVEAAFSGHYVLLVGLDDERGGFLINDPARDDERTFVHVDALEAARLAEGTDEDLLLVPAYQSAPQPPDTDSTPKIARVLADAAAIAKAEAGGEGGESPNAIR